MNSKAKCSLIIGVLLVACDVQAQRNPLAPVELSKIEFPPGGTRDRFNSATQKWEKYDLDRRIVYEEASGNFLVQWNGVDGKRNTIVYRPANRMYAVVSARIEFDSASKVFRYEYALRNLPSSERDVHSFYLEAKAPVDKAGLPDQSWSYSTPLTDYLVKVLRVVGGWTWSHAGGEKSGLSPGESTYGFSIQSAGLPGTVKCFVAGRPGMKGVGEDPPEELMAALDPVSWLIPSGITVGPVAPPAELDPIAFLAGIRTMIDISLDQGWITTPALAATLRGSIDEGLAALQRRDLKTARASLARLLQQVEVEREKRLLSESFALLRYNAEYLMARLPQSE